MADPVDWEAEEYRALRAEILQSMSDGNNIMALGLAGMGFLLGATLNTNEPAAIFIVLSLIIPIMSGLTMSLWFAAQERIARASHYLTGTEHRMKAARGTPDAVSWESWLRRPKALNQSEHFWSTERSGIALFTMISLASVALGLVLLDGSLRSSTVWPVLVASGVTIVASSVVIHRRYRRWRTWLKTSFDGSVDADPRQRLHPGDAEA